MGNHDKREGAEVFLGRLISTALAQEHLRGISTILKMTADRFEAVGCALWELGGPIADSSNDTLFILAEWFQNGRFMRLDSLDVATSASGEAVENGKAQYIESLEDSRVDHRKNNLTELGVQSFAAIPVRFASDHPGVLTIYRHKQVEWCADVQEQLEQIAPLIAGLYEAIHNRVRTSVVEEASRLLQNHSIVTKKGLTLKQVTKTVKDVARLIADSFQCLEVSIFLRDPRFSRSDARLIATTWNRPKQDQELTVGARSHGATAWVLKKGRPVTIFDLQRAEQQKVSLGRRYPGLVLTELDSVIRQVRADPRMADHKRLPPVGLMAVPILRRGGVRLGVVRCFVPTKNPFFFSDREVVMLEVLGTLLAGFWSSWMARRDIDEENLAWRSLIKGIKTLNALTEELLALHAPLEKMQNQLMRRGLEILKRTIPTATILDVRLLHKEGYLYFADVLGDAWQEGTREEIKDRIERRFETRTPEPESAGAWVVRNNRPYEVKDRKRDTVFSPTFSETMLFCAPISDGREVLGVLDLRTTSSDGMPKNAGQVAALLGQQLGLCIAVARRTDQLQKTAEEQKTQRKDQSQIYEDLSHQLKTPVLHGYERIRAVVDGEVSEDRIRWNLLAVRGQSRRAVRVVTSLGLFAELAEGRPIHINTESLTSSYLVKMLIESAADTELLIKPERGIRFDVDRESIGKVDVARFNIDRALLEQAVGNIFDNARKYSNPRTTVNIKVGLTKSGKLRISTINSGLKVRGAEIGRMKQRLWRSDVAKVVTGEGTGIGLWIVDNIMKAHSGELEINPTISGATEVKLIFPSS